jgi:signal transduction histidine kinase
MRLAIERAFHQVREAEVQALVAMQGAVAEASDQDDLLRRLTSILAKAFHARAARILVAAKFPRELRRARFIQRGNGQRRLIADPRMRREGSSFWSYPLGDSAIIQLGFPVRYPWLPRERTLLEIASALCNRALERARLQHEIRRLESAAREAEQEERRRIGRELHDETAQSLLLLRLRLEMWERKAPDAVAAGLKDCRELAENAVIELRRIIAALSPTALERLGLRSALGHLVGQFRKLYPASVRVRIQGNVAAIPRHLQEGIYRAAQECLQNVAKHSRATTVIVSLRVSDKGVRLRIKDNGAGFKPDAAKGKRKSFGIRGMRERAALMDGILSVETAPGSGTTVTLDVPHVAALVAENGKNSRIVD